MTFSFEAIGTHWTIDIFDQISDSSESDILKSVKDRIDVYDKHYSRFRKDSLVTEMSQHAGDYVLPEDGELLFSIYEQVYRLTNGSVTPLIGNVLSDAGYDAAYSFEPKALQKPLAWEDALEYVFPHVRIKKPVLIDVGAAGKGYLVDLVGGVLKEKGIHAFTINAGGDILHSDISDKLIRVGLEHPSDPTSVIGVAHIGNESICGSAGNRRAWKQFHHIMDPKALSSPTHILSVWVIAKEARIADILTTCLFFVDPEVMQTEFSFDYFILYPDFSFKKSDRFNAELFF